MESERQSESNELNELRRERQQAIEKGDEWVQWLSQFLGHLAKGQFIKAVQMAQTALKNNLWGQEETNQIILSIQNNPEFKDTWQCETGVSLFTQSLPENLPEKSSSFWRKLGWCLFFIIIGALIGIVLVKSGFYSIILKKLASILPKFIISLPKYFLSTIFGIIIETAGILIVKGLKWLKTKLFD